MKLEFLASGSPDCPLIRLYDFDSAEVGNLRGLFERLSTGALSSIPLQEEPGIEAIGGCRFELRLGEHDCGVSQIAPQSFECVLTAEGWCEVTDLTEPFCKPGASLFHYQWLNEDGEVSLLLSQNGLW